MSLPIDLVDGFTVFLIFSSKGLGQHKRCLLQAMAAAVSVYSQLSENLFLSRTSGTRSAVTRSGALAFVKLPAPLYQTKGKWTMINAKKNIAVSQRLQYKMILHGSYNSWFHKVHVAKQLQSLHLGSVVFICGRQAGHFGKNCPETLAGLH